ncbi:MAG TPA: cbb3-type cytochrome c oxidase subunit II [Coriobacteriia bacterium]|jgi:mono/diheme cytochrome c family protein
MADDEKRRWLPLYAPSPRDWASHPTKRMLMTPTLVFFGAIFAYAIPTLVAAFFHVLFFHPPISGNWAPLSTSNPISKAKVGSPFGDAVQGRRIFLANGCLYCHSGYNRPQDTREGLFYLYNRVSLPGDFATSDDSPNLFGTARIGPSLSEDSGFHPDDWHFAHFSDPRYVDPDSLMPRMMFMSDDEVRDLTFFIQTRSGKSGLVRYAGQIYMKKLFLAAGNLPPPPTGFAGDRKSLKEVSLEQSNAPTPPDGGVDGLDWPDPINLNHVDRGYWLMSNPMPVTTENLIRGRVIFQERCIGCHGQGGGAVSKACGFMSPMPIHFDSVNDAIGGNDVSPGDYYYRVLRGINGTAMENFGTRLRVDDIWKVVLFLKTIPNGGLDPDRVPTPDMYIQWVPTPGVTEYIAKHPIGQNKDYLEYDKASEEASAHAAGTTTIPPAPSGAGTEAVLTSTDPFMLEARRDLAGLNDGDHFVVPGYGEVSLKKAAEDIKGIYEQLLDSAYASYGQRGGTPVPTDAQKNALPDLPEELR